MKKFIVVTLLLLGSIISYINCADANQISLNCVFYDLTPQTNPDFEIANPNKVITGLVKSTLGKDRKPVYCCGNNPAPNLVKDQFVIHNQSTFNSWFHNVAGVNKIVNLPLTLTKKNSSEDARIYFYQNDAFFPLDGKGWDDGTTVQTVYRDAFGNKRNFHFCMELHSSFTYLGGEVFTFIGDDDVWVFIDNKMVVDLGAPHTKQQGVVNLDNLGLIKGNSYNFDFFYCERHSVDSHILIETSILLACSYIDFCGVCEGDGSSCCQDDTTCNDGNPCTIDKCPPPATQRAGRSIQSLCGHETIQCNSTPCFDYACSLATGKCEKQDQLYCSPGTNCIENVCAEDKGGCYPTKVDCRDPDFPDNCFNNVCGNGTCYHLPINCDDANECTIDSCKNESGCVHEPKSCPDDDNHCTIDSCDKKTGTCLHTPIPNCVPCKNGTCNIIDKCFPLECDPTGAVNCVTKKVICDDSNPCTIDSCKDGGCTYTAKTCIAADNCSIPTCNAKTGLCENFNTCDDHSVCTIDTCVFNKSNNTWGCSHSPNKCDDGNPCTEDSCNLSKGGCVHTPLNCSLTHDTICGVGVCDKTKGCQTVPRVCPTDAFCLSAKCDLVAGCVQFDKKCVPDNPNCATGVCHNDTKKCTEEAYSPLPFKCQSTAVKAGVAVGAAAIAGIVIGGAAALGLAAFGGKKGYDAWKNMKQAKMAVSADNPLYSPNPNASENPLYNG